MRQARFLRVGMVALLAGCIASAGCTHNYYYGYATAVPPCGPTVVPGAVPYGSVCDVPTQVVGGGATVAQGQNQGQSPARTAINAGPPRAPRVVVSEPSGGSRFPWRRADPESSLATTRIEGGLDDPTVNR